MVFYIGDGNGQTRGKAEDATRRGRWRYDTRIFRHPRPETLSGLIRDQAGLRQTASDSRLVFLARANANDAFDVGHENLAVANLAGASRTNDCVNDLIRL
jgi:hypothetical protein